MSANKNHPELEHGEVFLRNTANPESKGGERLGRVAYSRKGCIVSGLYPVFCKRIDLDLCRTAKLRECANTH